MKLPGYCKVCHKIKQVRVSNAELARGVARRVYQGICDACQQAEDDKRKARQMENLRVAHELHKRVYGRREERQ